MYEEYLNIEFILKMMTFWAGLYFILDYIFKSQMDNTVGYIILFLNSIVVISVFVHMNYMKLHSTPSS